MKVIVDFDRAEQLFGPLIAACEKKQYPYNIIRPPQVKENLPKELVWGSQEHACFLFCACYYMRGGIKSETAFKALSEFYTARPAMFRPEKFEELSSELQSEIRSQLVSYGLGFQSKQISIFWNYNFRKIFRYWNGNPLEIFKQAKDYESLCSLIIDQNRRNPNNPSGFYGFRHKMVSMLTYFYIHAGMVNSFSHPIPIDFHVLRLLVAHEVLWVEGFHEHSELPVETFQRAARSLTQLYCASNKVDELLLCDALWLYSNFMCSQHPANMSHIGKRRGRKTRVRPFKFAWTEARESTYLATCGSCKVASTCKYQIPSGLYYVQGKLQRRGFHQKPPQQFLALD